jgi:hypothetical protein
MDEQNPAYVLLFPSFWELGIGNWELGIGNWGLGIEGLPITDYRLPITDYRLPITNPLVNSQHSTVNVRCLSTSSATA